MHSQRKSIIIYLIKLMCCVNRYLGDDVGNGCGSLPFICYIPINLGFIQAHTIHSNTCFNNNNTLSYHYEALTISLSLFMLMLMLMMMIVVLNLEPLHICENQKQSHTFRNIFKLSTYGIEINCIYFITIPDFDGTIENNEHDISIENWLKNFFFFNQAKDMNGIFSHIKLCIVWYWK